MSQNPLVIIDGAHNPDGAAALLAVMKDNIGATAIVGVMRDKNYDEVLSKTLPHLKNVICVTPAVPRSLPKEELVITAQKYCDNVFAANTLDDAIKHAKELCDNKPIFVFGSLYLASQIRPLLKK